MALDLWLWVFSFEIQICGSRYLCLEHWVGMFHIRSWIWRTCIFVSSCSIFWCTCRYHYRGAALEYGALHSNFFKR